MFNYKNWKLYYPGDEAIAGEGGNPKDEPSSSPVIDENGNSITPDSLKKNMTIPAEAPGNDLEKVLNNINGADPAYLVEGASGLIKQMNDLDMLPAVTSEDDGKVLGVVDGAWAKDSNSVVVTVPSALQPYLAQAVQGAIQYALQNQTQVTMSRTNIASADVPAILSYISTLHEYANSGKQVWTALGDNGKTLTISLGGTGYACMFYQITSYGALTAYCSTFVVDSDNAGIDLYGIFVPAT